MIKVMEYLYPNAVIFQDWALQDDGEGLYFSVWNQVKLGEKPTIEFLTAQEKVVIAEEEAKAEADKAAAQTKLAALGLTTDDLKALGL